MSKKIIISKDVVFEEDKKWEWSETTKETSSMGLEWVMKMSHKSMKQDMYMKKKSKLTMMLLALVIHHVKKLKMIPYI